MGYKHGWVEDHTLITLKTTYTLAQRNEAWDDLFASDPDIVLRGPICSNQSQWSFKPDVVPGDQFPHAAHLDYAFDLSLGSPDLFLIGGGGIQGNITFRDDSTLSHTARVVVQARLDDAGWNALMDTVICKRTLRSMSNGIHLSVRSILSQELYSTDKSIEQSKASDHLLQSIYFDIVVSMPSNPSPSVLQVPELSIMMPSMNLDMILSAPYVFGTVAFRSNYGNIHIKVCAIRLAERHPR